MNMRRGGESLRYGVRNVKVLEAIYWISLGIGYIYA